MKNLIAAGVFLAGMAAAAQAEPIRLALHGAMATPSRAQEPDLSAQVYRVTPEGPGNAVGEVHFRDTSQGLLIVPALKDLSPGPHGTHIHEHAACGTMEMDGRMHLAGAAGGHYDPDGAGKHAGPYGDGHLGDLPNMIVEADGTATIPVLAPRLAVLDIRGRSVMIHAGADRYREHAMQDHGKGGMRMYCGVIPE